MEYVYVVTVSGRGAEKGEFAGTPIAYEALASAELAAGVYRKALGGRFRAVDRSGQPGHVVRRWDSDEFSVWLERLIFEPAD